MGRVLQCLVCITAMSSVLPQRDYYQQSIQTHVQTRNLQFNRPITENLYTRTLEARKHKTDRIQEHTRFENGTFFPQIVKRGALESMPDSSSSIVFPGQTSNEPRITEECRKRSFCTFNEVRNYPETEATNLVVEGKVRNQTDGGVDDSVQIAQRLGGDTNDIEIPLCTANQTMIYPQTLPDRNGVHHFVVNPEGMPVQGFFVELCQPAGRETSCNLIAGIQDGYKGICKQKYVYRLVDVIENNKLVQKQLKLPGCCSCVVYRLP